MSLITQNPLVLNDPALSAILLIIAFSILIVACLVCLHLRDKALREMLDEALSEIPKAERKDLIAVVLHGERRKRPA